MFYDTFGPRRALCKVSTLRQTVLRTFGILPLKFSLAKNKQWHGCVSDGRTDGWMTALGDRSCRTGHKWRTRDETKKCRKSKRMGGWKERRRSWVEGWCVEAGLTRVVWRTSDAAVSVMSDGRRGEGASHHARWIDAGCRPAGDVVDGSCCQNVIRICRTDWRLAGHLATGGGDDSELFPQHTDTRV